jgi:Ca2+-binding RTX toxin-like protein
LALLVILGLAATATVRVSASADAAVDPAIEAQLVVYEINRARRSPAAFAIESNITLPEPVSPRPPVAVNSQLEASAEFKANEMAAFSYFAHQSTATGKWPNWLARDNGYPLPGWWSDDANYIESLNSGSTVPIRVVGSFAGSPSHRRHIFGEGTFADYLEIGVGRSNSANYWAVHTAPRETPVLFVTGVVFVDDDGDGLLDLGEGLPNVTVEAAGKQTKTNAGGGYAVEVAPGTHTVSASGPGLNGVVSARFTVVSHNVGVDFVSSRAVVFPYELCQGVEPTILGTDGSDVIEGTDGRDVIHGFGGDDLIYGLGGDDLICGGPGDDSINSGSGNDTIFGGSGDDTILGKAGGDTIRGGPGNDLLDGGSGRDRMFGNKGNDTLRGGAGLDRILDGGPGLDRCGDARTTVRCGA